MPNGFNVEIPFTKSSVVLVGEGFSPALIDRHAIFGGYVDRDSLLIAGPMLQCTYLEGQFSVSAMLNRIDFRAHKSDEVMPQELVNVAVYMADFLDNNEPPPQISALGLNHDIIMDTSLLEDSLSGQAFCANLFRDGLISAVTNAESSSVDG